MSDEQVLAMPVKRFWLLNRNIDRIKADDDIRAIRVSLAKTSNEAYHETMGSLRKEMGQVSIYDEAVRSIEAKPDRAGLMNLKTMGNIGR